VNNVDLVFGSFVEWLGLLPGEIAAILADQHAWLAIVAAGVLFAGAALVGGAIVRTFGLLPASCGELERWAISLSVGVLAIVATWATVRSGGRSSFTPIGASIVLAMAAAAFRRLRSGTAEQTPTAEVRHLNRGAVGRWAVGLLGLVFAIGLIYGSTMAPSPRDGVQPVEFMDEAYYSVLASDLAATGIESVYSPGGLEMPAGTPSQTWYHWGEPWLAALPIFAMGVQPMPALFYASLPILLMCSGLLGATLAHRLAGITSRGVLTLAGAATVLLSPIPSSTFFGSWARGNLFGVTTYGLGLVVTLLLLCLVSAPGPWLASAPGRLLASAVAASLIPVHFVLAIVIASAAIGVAALRTLGQALGSKRRSRVDGPTAMAVGGTVVLAAICIVYGLVTGHGISIGSPMPAAPFGLGWRDGVVLTAVGAATLLCIPIAWLATWRQRAVRTDLLLFATVAVAGGALIWGIRVGDYNAFHFFYGPLAAVGPPMAVVAVWIVVDRLRAVRYRRLAGLLIAILVLQTGIGSLTAIERLRAMGPGRYDPIPLAVLAVIRDLPDPARLAYRCAPGEEVAHYDAMLVSITAHTGRRVVPMCFFSDWLRELHGQAPSPATPGPFFALAPQRALYPTADAEPSAAEVASFLRTAGVGYQYVDGHHVGALVPSATVVYSDGAFQVVRLP
jgi:hypothetical protein